MDRSAYHHIADNEATHWWFVGRRHFIAKQLDRLGASDLKILEVGSGTGGNLALLQTYGSVSALEMEPYAIEVSNSRIDTHVEKGSLPHDHSFQSGSFDLILLYDVLEHIEDDLTSLKGLTNLLRPGGKIHITVPAHPFLWSHHDTLHHHFRRYTKQSLKDVAISAGFKVEKLTAFNFLLFPLAIIARCASMLVPSKTSLGSQHPSAWLNGLLLALFRFETNINHGAGWPTGLSLFIELHTSEN